MVRLNKESLNKLHNANDLLDGKYGKVGTSTREEFNKETIAYYFGGIIKEKRKELHLTQKELAEKIGIQREYIAKVEKGITDIQLSSFIRIARALEIESISI